MTNLINIAQELTQKILNVADEFIEQIIEPIGDIGSPEKIVGKKYEEWTSADLLRLGAIYGPEPNALSEFIFNKEYKILKELEES